MPTHKLSAEILNAAIVGFEQQKLRIDAQIAELRQMLTGTPTAAAAAPGGPKGKRRKMSAAVRKRMGDAQRKRWAEAKKESEPSPVAPEAAKPKRKLSAAGKKAIAEASRRRWARVRAEAATAAKTRQPPAAKKAAAKKPPVKAS